MPSHLIDRHHALPNGDRVRLRLPHLGDRHRVDEFLERLGLRAGDLDVQRGLRWTPNRPWSVVAIRRDGSTERIVGIVTMAPEDGAPTLLADDPAVYDLLARVLAERAGAPDRRVA